MTRLPFFLVSGTAVAALLLGCGGETTTIAADPQSAEPAPNESTQAPPRPGDYPDFTPSDYTYTLTVGCFCADGGAPIAITVVDGKVVEAVYAADGRGVRQGAAAPDFRELTINDVVDEANDTQAASVDVDWPPGQDYPSRVAIDRIAKAVDDEVSYVLTDVTVQDQPR